MFAICKVDSFGCPFLLKFLRKSHTWKEKQIVPQWGHFQGVYNTCQLFLSQEREISVKNVLAIYVDFRQFFQKTSECYWKYLKMFRPTLSTSEA